MVQDIDARDTRFRADFDSVWGSPTDFDDMSGLFGDEGTNNFPASPSRFDTSQPSITGGSFFTGTNGHRQAKKLYQSFCTK